MKIIYCVENEEGNLITISSNEGSFPLCFYCMKSVSQVEPYLKEKGMKYKVTKYLSIDPPKKRDLDGEFFDRDYFETESKNGLSDYFNKQELDKVVVCNRLRDTVPNFKDGAKILELGCAYGQNVTLLNSWGVDAYGTDVSKYAINKTGEKNLFVEDMTQEKFYEKVLIKIGVKEFDIIFSNITLEHMYPEKVLTIVKNFYDLTADGGYNFHGIDLDCDEVTHYCMLKRSDWVEIFESVGFKEVKIGEQLTYDNFFLLKKGE